MTAAAAYWHTVGVDLSAPSQLLPSRGERIGIVIRLRADSQFPRVAGSWRREADGAFVAGYTADEYARAIDRLERSGAIVDRAALMAEFARHEQRPLAGLYGKRETL